MSKTLVELSSSAISKMVKDGYFNKHMTEAEHMKKKKKHNCASKVKSEEYGIGTCIPGQHTMLEDGTVTHYDVKFKAGIVENYPVNELEVLEESMHEHYDNEEKNALMDDMKVKVQKLPYMGPKDNEVKKRMVAGSSARERRASGAGKGAAAMKMLKNSTEHDVDFTIIEHNAFVIEMGDQLYFEDFLNAAKAIVESNEELVNEEVSIAEQFFSDGDITIILEAFSRDFIKDKVKAAQDAGHKVSTPKFSMKDDKPHAEYTVTHKDSGVKKKHIFHGNVTKHENLGSSD